MVDQFIPRIPNARSASFGELVTSSRPFVDKTAFLKPLLLTGCEVTQFLRPRNFGRTMSMDMLASFVEMNYQDPDDTSRQERLFQGLQRKSDLKAVIIAYKESEDARFVTLDNVCDKALEQIETCDHDLQLKQDKFREILKYGIAFNGKRSKVRKADPE